MIVGSDRTLKMDVPDEPLSVEPFLSICRRKLKGEKGIARKWLREKIKQCTSPKPKKKPKPIFASEV